MNVETMTLTFSAVTVGDTIVVAQRKRYCGKVTGKQSRNTRCTIWVDCDGIERTYDAPLNEVVSVERWVPTEEEKEADRRRDAVRRVRNMMNDALAARPTDALRTYAEKSKWEGDTLRWYDFDSLMHTQARYAMWHRVRSAVESLAGDDGILVGDEDTALLAVVHHRVLAPSNDYPQDPLSRSTAVLANLMEDVERFVRAKAAHSLKDWGDVSEFAAAAANALLELQQQA